MSNSTKIVDLADAFRSILAARFEGKADVQAMAQAIAADFASIVRPPEGGASLLYLDGDEVGCTLPPRRSAEWLRDNLARRIAANPSFMDDVIERLDEL